MSQNSVNQLIVVMETRCVFFEVIAELYLDEVQSVKRWLDLTVSDNQSGTVRLHMCAEPQVCVCGTRRTEP
jgi:hypothetical protein